MPIYLTEEQRTRLSNHNFNEEDLLTVFRDSTSPNHNSTTLWHGIDDITHDIIPMFLSDNMIESDLELLKNYGYKCKE